MIPKSGQIMPQSTIFGGFLIKTLISSPEKCKISGLASFPSRKPHRCLWARAPGGSRQSSGLCVFVEDWGAGAFNCFVFALLYGTA